MEVEQVSENTKYESGAQILGGLFSESASELKSVFAYQIESSYLSSFIETDETSKTCWNIDSIEIWFSWITIS